MAKEDFKEIFLLLEEWKDIVEKANTDITIRNMAKDKINMIIKELHEPKPSWDNVKPLLESLENINGLKKYAINSMTVIESICNMNI